MEGAKINEKQVEVEDTSPSLRAVYPRQEPPDVESPHPENHFR